MFLGVGVGGGVGGEGGCTTGILAVNLFAGTGLARRGCFGFMHHE